MKFSEFMLNANLESKNIIKYLFFIFFFLLFCFSVKKNFHCFSIYKKSWKKNYKKAERYVKNLKICKKNPVINSDDNTTKDTNHSVINLNSNNKTTKDTNQSVINLKKNYNNVFNSINSQILKTTYISNRVNTECDIKTNQLYFIDLTSISKNGLIILAPILSKSSINKKSDKKKLNKQKYVKNLKKKIKFFINTYLKNKSRIKNQIDCIFNMSSYQQQHFLGYYGNGTNPMFIARDEFQNKLINKKNDFLDSKICVDHLNKMIQSYLKNRKFNQIIKCSDESFGLGGKNIYKIRKLEFEENFSNKPSKKNYPKRNTVPKINFVLYNLKKKMHN